MVIVSGAGDVCDTFALAAVLLFQSEVVLRGDALVAGRGQEQVWI